MIAQGVRSTAPCGTCGGELDLDLGQWVREGQLWWGRDGNCRTD
ncbi:hypothetical protein ACWGB8_25620 [Kitasatospora sp. NPDC054939]